MTYFGKIKQCVKCDSVVHFNYNVCPCCGATQSKKAQRVDKEIREKLELPSKGKNNK